MRTETHPSNVNRHLTTGIAFGYIRADHIDPDMLNDLLYSHGTDVSYKEALAEHLAQERRLHEGLQEGDHDDEDFDEDEATQAFADEYQCDEPIIEGEHEGVKYRTSWLGGAQHLWVFESPVLTKCRPCSLCVPGAGNLDQVGDYLAYGVPASWLTADFMREACEDEYRVCDVVLPGETVEKHYWLPIEGEPHEHGDAFASEGEMWEDCYKVHYQQEAPNGN